MILMLRYDVMSWFNAKHTYKITAKIYILMYYDHNWQLNRTWKKFWYEKVYYVILNNRLPFTLRHMSVWIDLIKNLWGPDHVYYPLIGKNLLTMNISGNLVDIRPVTLYCLKVTHGWHELKACLFCACLLSVTNPLADLTACQHI